MLSYNVAFLLSVSQVCIERGQTYHDCVQAGSFLCRDVDSGRDVMEGYNHCVPGCKTTDGKRLDENIRSVPIENCQCYNHYTDKLYPATQLLEMGCSNW